MDKSNTAYDLFDSLSDGTLSSQAGLPISIEDWLSDPYYIGSFSKELYPFWRDRIIEFEEGGYNQLILTGSFGSGKTVVANVLQLRRIYQLSMNRPVAPSIGLAESSIIIFLYLSISLFQANLTGYGKIVKMIDSIGYFKDHFPRNREKDSMVEFPDKEIVLVPGSDIGHIKGGDLLAVTFDESNFRQGGDRSKLEKATEIYLETLNRRESRFMGQGVDPSLSIIVSSSDSISSFTEQQIERAVHDPKTMVVRATTWDVRPTRYSGETFWVFSGNNLVEPFLADDEMSLKSYCMALNIPPATVENLPEKVRQEFIKIPVEHRRAFEESVSQALADLAGVSKGTAYKYFSDEQAFEKCFPRNTYKDHPFTKPSITISYRSTENVWDYLRADWKGLDPQYLYYTHIDQSLTTDATGLAISHPEFDEDESKMGIVLDLVVQITPPKKPDQISIKKVRDFLFWLQEKKKISFGYASYDSFGSEEAIQECNRLGIEAGKLSVDKDSTQYDLFTSFIKEGKVRGYYYKVLRDELFGVEKDLMSRKVDHPRDGSKDCGDAVVGSVYHSYMRGLSLMDMRLRTV